jgi:hypothetical protein
VALTSWVRRPAAVAAVLAWAVVLLAGSGYAVVVAHQREASLGRLLSIASVVVPFTVVGWLIARQVPGNPIGWLCLGFGLVESLSFMASTVAEQALVTAPGSLPLGREAAWIGDSTWWLGPVAVLPPLPLLFPTGRQRAVGGSSYGCWPVELFLLGCRWLSGHGRRVAHRSPARERSLGSGSWCHSR